MKFYLIVLIISFRVRISLTHYIDSPLIYSGNDDPTPKFLPKNWLDNFMQNTKSIKDFMNNTNTYVYPHHHHHHHKNSNKNKHDLTGQKCKDPSETYLSKLLAQLYNDYYDINFIILKLTNSFKNETNELRIFELKESTENPNSKIISTYGSRECILAKMNSIDKHVTLCPWHYNLIERNDRYPFKRLSAACNCKSKCLSNSPSHKCAPISLPMPVLIRGKCHNGVFEWEHAIEDVSTSCACVNSS